MRIIELKRKDGKPLYAPAGAISAWTESPEQTGLTDIWIGGKMFTLGETVEDVNRKLDDTQSNPSAMRRRS